METAAATEGAKDVAHEAKSQASAVVSDARSHLHDVTHQARTELRSQLHSRSEQAAGGLQALAQQLSALRNGRPEEAGRINGLLGDAQQRVQSYAETLQQRGPNALVEDIGAFARRRPGVFLLAAGAAGFAAGRLARSAAAAQHDQQGSSSALGSGSYGGGSYTGGSYGGSYGDGTSALGAGTESLGIGAPIDPSAVGAGLADTSSQYGSAGTDLGGTAR